MANGERPRVVTPDVLSPAELRVAKLLCMQCSTADIAEQISASAEQVERLCEQILQKVGVKDRSALIRWAKVYDIVRW